MCDSDEVLPHNLQRQVPPCRALASTACCSEIHDLGQNLSQLLQSGICRVKMRLATSASCFSELGQGRRAGCGHAPRPTSCSEQAARLPACHFACLRGFRPAHACMPHDLPESHDLSVHRALADKKDVICIPCPVNFQAWCQLCSISISRPMLIPTRSCTVESVALEASKPAADH